MRNINKLMIVLICLSFIGCSIEETNGKQEEVIIGDKEQKDLFVELTKSAIEDKMPSLDSETKYSAFDIMFEDNKYGVSDAKEIEENNNDADALKEVEENESKQVIINVKKDNNYSSIRVVSRKVMEEDEETSIAYTVVYDNEFYWLVMYNEERAYAIQDTLGTLKQSVERE